MEEIYCKYYKQKKQKSTDYGQTWVDIPGEYRTGELYEYDSSDCEYIPVPIPPSEYDTKYLTFVFEERGRLIEDGFTTAGNNGLKASKDSGNTWISFGDVGFLNPGEEVMLKYTGPLGTNDENGQYLIPTAKAHIEGNIMSLRYGDDFIDKKVIEDKNCFCGLFSKLTGNASETSANITSAENLVLPATALTVGCYSYMFYGCTNMIKCPKILPAETLKSYCYWSMFQGCTSLTTAPELPAIKIIDSAYKYMFDGCTSLNYIKCLAKYGISNELNQNTTNWVYGVSASGKFVKNEIMPYEWPISNYGIPSGWTIYNNEDPEKEYLTFKALENGTFSFNGNPYYEYPIQYSLDSGTTWSTASSAVTTPTIQSGNTVMWKGEGFTSGDAKRIGTFSSTGRFTVQGNAMSLRYGDNFSDKYNAVGFQSLFSGCTGLTSAENMILPSSSTTQGCYYEMFYGCTSLTTAPDLPANISNSRSGGKSAYNKMFQGCSSLNYIKCTTSRLYKDDYGYNDCTLSWVDGVAATGTFVKNANLDWGTCGTSSIPCGWTVIDAT